MIKHEKYPWWKRYLLVSPLRRLAHDPNRIVAPYIRPGLTILEPGPGMGFFTIEMARLVGPSGRVIAIDIEPQMIEGLRRRACKAGLLDIIDSRLSTPASLGLVGLDGTVDFTFAFAAIHEMPSPSRFFSEVSRAMREGAMLFLAEPEDHVSESKFNQELKAAGENGFILDSRPKVEGSLTALLLKQGPPR